MVSSGARFLCRNSANSASPGHAGLHAHGNQPLRRELGQQCELSQSPMAAHSAAQRHAAESHKPEGSHPLVIDGPVRLRHRVAVARADRLDIGAAGGRGGREAGLPEAVPVRPRQGRVEKAEFKQQWNIYQNFYDRDYTATIPAARSRSGSASWTAIGWRSVRSGSSPWLPARRRLHSR